MRRNFDFTPQGIDQIVPEYLHPVRRNPVSITGHITPAVASVSHHSRCSVIHDWNVSKCRQAKQYPCNAYKHHYRDFCPCTTCSHALHSSAPVVPGKGSSGDKKRSLSADSRQRLWKARHENQMRGAPCGVLALFVHVEMFQISVERLICVNKPFKCPSPLTGNPRFGETLQTLSHPHPVRKRIPAAPRRTVRCWTRRPGLPQVASKVIVGNCHHCLTQSFSRKFFPIIGKRAGNFSSSGILVEPARRSAGDEGGTRPMAQGSHEA